MIKDKRIAVVGAGHMGRALIGGILRAKLTDAKHIACSRRNPQALAEMRKTFGIRAVASNIEAVKDAEIIILAVKPQMAASILSEIAPKLRKSQFIISIMAGIRSSAIAKMIKKPCPIVRAMPNTPCLVDAGATAISAGDHAGEGELDLAEAIFASVGKVARLPEVLLDAATGLSGTGPVYIYTVIEAMIDGGVKMGIPRETAAKLAAQTVFGAAKLVLETGKHPAILKDEVTTPGGTAINAIHVLEAKGLRSVLIDAIVAATLRSQELSRLYGQE
jgi:pyrroline-5-carboxylate reductase